MSRLFICFFLTIFFISQAVAMYDAPGIYYMYDAPSIDHMKTLLGFCKNKPNTVLMVLGQLVKFKSGGLINKEVLEVTDDDNNTLLHLAASYGNKQSLDYALQLEINTELKNKNDKTATDIIRQEIERAKQEKNIDALYQYADCLELIKQNSLDK